MIYDWNLEISARGGETVAFEVVGEVSLADYSWWTEAIVRRKSDGALFFLTDSGCSCYGFGDGMTTGDLEPIFSIEEGLRKSDHRTLMQKSLDLKDAVIL